MIELSSAAHRVAGGDLSQRVDVTSQDAQGEIAEAFNTMSTKLERQHELRRRATFLGMGAVKTTLNAFQTQPNWPVF